MTAASKITVRKLNQVLGSDIPEFWLDDNALLTMVMTALSVSFPAGERYFIDSVRHFQKHISDPDLQKDIRAFIGQEANHMLEHDKLNDLMDSKGYPAKAMADFVRDRIAELQAASTPEENLARTAALEHFTAIMAGAMLDHPELIDATHPDVARIWAWHAIEEVEHRSVAFDVYQSAVGDDDLRRVMMAKVTFFFILVNVVRTTILMRRSGRFWDLKGWAKGLNVLWGKPGLFRKIIPDYLSYYRKDFHPSLHDYSVGVRRAKQLYLRETELNAYSTDAT